MSHQAAAELARGSAAAAGVADHGRELAPPGLPRFRLRCSGARCQLGALVRVAALTGPAVSTLPMARFEPCPVCGGELRFSSEV